MKQRFWLYLLFCFLVSGLSPAHAQSGYTWLQSIGRPGTGNTPLGNLAGVALDASGNLYITDTTNYTVDVLDNKGNFLFAFGSYSSFGAVPGSFSSPDKITRDSAGNFYVVDQSNNRIQKFDAKGRFLFQFGTYGSRSGQLYYPTGITIDGAGNIYVADTNNNRIEKFNSKGVFVLKFGTSGSGNGLFNAPQAVTLDSAGNLYVADQGNNRIQKFSATGSYLLKFGSNGSGNGQFSNLNDVVVDSAGNIYVADTGNNRVQKFNTSGAYVNAVPLAGVQGLTLDSSGNLYAVTSSGTIAVINTATLTSRYTIGPAMSPEYLAVDASGNTYVTDYNGRLLKFGPNGKALQNFSIPTNALGVAVDSSGNIYVVDYTNSQILKYPASGGTPIAIATSGSGNGQVSNPYGIAVDSSNNLYVADTSNHRIEKFSANGTFVSNFGAYGTGNGQFYYPEGVTVDNAGNIYVADTYNNRIQKLSKTGAYLLQFGKTGTANGQFSYPTDVTVDGSGNIYATDYNNNRIEKFSATGAFVSAFGTSISSPKGIRVNNAGNLLVAEYGNYRIDQFSPSGQVLGGYDIFGPNYASFNHPLGIRLDSSNNLYVTGTSYAEKVTSTGNWLGNFGSFSGAAGLTLDATGNIYVVDRGGNSVQKFNSNLTNLSGFGVSGSGNGQFSSPNGIAVDSKGNLYVTDSGNARVQKFSSALAYAGQFGSSGTGDGQFSTPAGIALTSGGNLLIADYSSSTSWVDLFSTISGFPYLGSFGYNGTSYGLFNQPYDVNLDSAGNIYVADEGNHRIQIFDPNANFLYSVGSVGGGSGQFIYPDGVAVDSTGLIYVADSGTYRVSIFAPTPLLTAITPTTAAAGSVALTLTATGSGFTPDAALVFNSTPLTTTFVSSTALSATIPATLLASGGNDTVTVMQAGGTSNGLLFTVTGGTKVPTVTGINPTSTTAGVASVALTVTGTNFVSGALIQFGTAGLPTTVVSATQLTATVPGSLLTTAGTVAVSVAQSGVTSNAVSFTINSAGAPPVITAVSPASVDQGSPAQTLTLTGTGFTSDAVVKFNGTALTTTFNSATQLTAALPAIFLTAAGSFPITVSQASGTSGAVGFAVNALSPTVTALSPLNARVGSSALTLSVTGTNFTTDAVVSFNGAALTTTFVSSTQVTVPLTATLLATAGVYPVVLTEASGASDPVYFAVNVAPPTVTGLSPTAVLKGSAAINLIVTGSGFTSDAVISFNGTPLTTTFGSSTQLTTTVPATLLATSGFYPVTVKQASGISRKVIFVVL